MNDAEYQRGVREAESDIANDACRLFIQTRGSRGRRLTDIMRDGYAVEVVHISDVTWDARLSFEEGYNSTIIAHLDTLYGAGTWDRIWAENQAFRREVYQKYLSDTSSTAPKAKPT